MRVERRISNARANRDRHSMHRRSRTSCDCALRTRMLALMREPSVDRPTTYCAPASQNWVLAATILASSMAFIDSTVVNVALAALQADLNASVPDVQWVVEAYAL